jgi:hypothetical protein
MQIPAGSKEYDRASGVVAFLLPGHTTSDPKKVIFRRKNVNSSGRHGVEITLIDGVAQADGSVLNDKVVLDITQVPGSTATSLGAIITYLTSIANSANFAAEINDMILPGAANIAP